jgi:hypothetical protein
VSYAPQSSPALRRLPACLALFWAVFAAPLEAQDHQRVTANAGFAKAPEGPTLGTLATGAEVQTGKVQGDWIEVSLDGWMFSRSLRATSREGFDLIVSARSSENLRQMPGGPLLGRLTSGALLEKAETKGGWTRVRRTVWLPRRALQGASASISGGRDAAPDVGRDGVETLRSTALSTTAGGQPVATLAPGARGRVVGRGDGWVRVQVEGWVRDSDVKVAPSDVLVGISQAQVRADPARYTGQTVEWRVQFIAIQKADELRPEIPAGRPYLLARGPLPESGFVYVIIPPSQISQFESTPALEELTIRAVVKTPTTRFLPNPVVELVEVVKR